MHCYTPSGDTDNSATNDKDSADSESGHTKVIVGISVTVGILVLIGTVVLIVVVLNYRRRSKRL